MGITSRIRPSAVTITTAATPIPTTALSGRKTMDIYNNGASTVYIGESDVTVNTGRPIPVGQNYPMDVHEAVVVYGIVASGTCEVRILEGN